MDYDVGPKLYHLTVRASDRGSPYRRETEKVFTVSVENVNDNKPIFEYARCELKLSKVCFVCHVFLTLFLLSCRKAKMQTHISYVSVKIGYI